MLTSFSSYVAVLGEAAVEDHRQEQVAFARPGRDRHEPTVAEERPDDLLLGVSVRSSASRADARGRRRGLGSSARPYQMPARYDGAMLPDGRRLGAHLPLGDGMVTAAERAAEIGLDALQVFSDNPTAWQRRAEPHPEIAAFRGDLHERGIAPLDDPRLVPRSTSPGSTTTLWARSVGLLAAELATARALRRASREHPHRVASAGPTSTPASVGSSRADRRSRHGGRGRGERGGRRASSTRSWPRELVRRRLGARRRRRASGPRSPPRSTGARRPASGSRSASTPPTPGAPGIDLADPAADRRPPRRRSTTRSGSTGSSSST